VGVFLVLSDLWEVVKRRIVFAFESFLRPHRLVSTLGKQPSSGVSEIKSQRPAVRISQRCLSGLNLLASLACLNPFPMTIV